MPFKTIEHERPSKRWWPPAIAAVVSLAVLIGCLYHISGDCLEIKGLFSYCEVHTK